MADTPVVVSVMLDCNDLEKEVAFWKEILGLEEKMRFPDYVFLGRLGEKGPRLAFQQVSGGQGSRRTACTSTWPPPTRRRSWPECWRWAAAASSTTSWTASAGP